MSGVHEIEARVRRAHARLRPLVRAIETLPDVRVQTREASTYGEWYLIKWELEHRPEDIVPDLSTPSEPRDGELMFGLFVLDPYLAILRDADPGQLATYLAQAMGLHEAEPDER